MKKIAILVPEHAAIPVIALSRFLFETVNRFLAEKDGTKPFEVLLVGQYAQMKAKDGPFTVDTDVLCKDAPPAGLVIIPPLSGSMQEGIAANKKEIEWIKAQYAQGAEIASLCVGAFLLAATGLMDGKKCSTHWSFEEEFRQTFPEVNLQDGRIITEDDGIYSSGGANSFWNLLLHLVEKYTDRATAILASKYFAIDIDRDSQAAFTMFKGQKTHNDDAIKDAQLYIEHNIEDKITVEELAARVALGRRSFERRFRQATNNSVLEYIQRVKIEAAKRSFETSRKNMNEVMFDVGYTDTKAFRAVFKKITGLTPIDYRNKYNKQIGPYQLP